LTDAFGWYFQKNNFTCVGPTFISPVAGSLHVWNDLSKIVHSGKQARITMSALKVLLTTLKCHFKAFFH
jgi:hypothetical protein